MNEYELEAGKHYYFETTRKYWTGRLVARSLTHAIIDDAAWIVRTGQFAEVMKNGIFRRVEPIPSGMRIRIWLPGTVVFDWPHPLPRDVVHG